MDRPPEIGDLEVALEVHQQVFWLDISVDDFFRVAVLEGVRQLSHILGALHFVEAAVGLLLKNFVHFSSGNKKGCVTRVLFDRF